MSASASSLPTTPRVCDPSVPGCCGPHPDAAGLAAVGLGLHYGAVEVLRGVALLLPAGAITAIVGPSGSGKSSFLSCCNRLEELTPGARRRGSIQLDGTEVAEIPARQLRRRIGMVFQKPTPFPTSVIANLEIALREHRLGDRSERRCRAETSLREVGLWDEVADRLQVDARQLSGGQQQRLCLARALVLEPQVLLLDEPCSALDPLATETIEALLRQLRGRLTIGIVTHHLAQARRLADRVAVFWQHDGVGTCIEEGETAAVFGAPREEETRAYVGGERG